jgi:hypothetical protein
LLIERDVFMGRELDLIRTNKTLGQRTKLRELYKVEALKEARKLLMSDLMEQATENDKQFVNSLAAKKEILAEFVGITGVHPVTARKYYDDAIKAGLKRINTSGIISQVLFDNYSILDAAKDNVDFADNGSAEKAQAINAYVNALKNMGDVVSKLQKYETDVDRNEVARERIKSEREVGVADIASRLQGSLEDKRAALKNALQNKKSIRELIRMRNAAIDVDDGDGEVIEVTDYVGVDVESGTGQ